ncbi:MAG: SAM-dependent methyltransferase [Bacteroidota bacterium]
MEKTFIHHPSSYRDPSGFIFMKEDRLYRQVNKVFAADFDLFISSGCYEKLVQQQLLLPHERINANLTGSAEWHATLQPEAVAFISYPYEWSFDMLKDAALLTLQLLRESVDFGLILKDATPYNIQWHRGRLVFIDSLSFERYREEEPWIAYRQFCEQFLGPLLLMHYRKMPLHPLLLAWPEGIPLNIIRSLLPGRSKFSLHAYLHVHLNARISSKGSAGNKQAAKFSRKKLLNLITSLETLIHKLKLPPQKSAWSDYYEEASWRSGYLEAKKKIIDGWMDSLTGVSTAADLGANDGEFSRLAANRDIYTISADFDSYCINNLYQSIKQPGEKNIQPLVIDLANPSPSIGVNNEERQSFFGRFKTDLVMALALIHHLAIGKNIPFGMMADFFRRTCKKYLIIEFVPKTDEKIQLMLTGKKDIYTSYSEESFRLAFEKYFTITRQQAVGSSGRVIYLMTKHES